MNLVGLDRREGDDYRDCRAAKFQVNRLACLRVWYGIHIFAERGLEIVILLAVGDKATQAKDIKSAQKLAKQI